MKLKIYTILSLVLVMMAFSSCLDASSLMDKEDVGDLYEKDVFKDPTYARYFVNDICYYFNVVKVKTMSNINNLKNYKS